MKKAIKSELDPVIGPVLRQVESSDSESNEDIELVCRFPHYQQPSQRAVGLSHDAETFVPSLRNQEREPEQEEVEADIMDIVPEADGEDNTAELGESLQDSSEELASEEDDPGLMPAVNHPQRERCRPRMLTYGALDEPTVVEVGVENLQVTMSPAYKRLWRPWMVSDTELTSVSHTLARHKKKR
ncbi:hypothetical protein F7725_021361%2C partial [Scomber scombrus]|uniref:Uncharacterized protein n=1 Tax=Scomber scombrus TaxID=13677 RepID=A0AAV1QB48_SCOSC